MVFDFAYDERTNYISKDGYYSRCEPHEASREEVLLWRRVQELEAILDSACPSDVQEVLSKIPRDGSVQEVAVNANTFARLRQHARHRVEIETSPQYNRRGVLGSLPLMVDGSPSRVLIAVNRDVPTGEV